MTSHGDPHPMPCMSHHAPPARFAAYRHNEGEEQPSMVVFTPRPRYGVNHSGNFYSHKEYRYDHPRFVEPVGTHSPQYDGPASPPIRDMMAQRQYRRNEVYPSLAPSWSNPSQAKTCSMVDRGLLRNSESFHSSFYRRFPRKSPLPDDFLPPPYNDYPTSSVTSHVHPTSTGAAQVTPLRPRSNSISAPESPRQQQQEETTVAGELRSNDIVCGRGAPTSFQRGNHEFRELIEEYQTVYLCSKRSDKPKIAMEVMKVLKSRQARFVRRVKTSYKGRFGWEEIDEKRAYEKVCQALREGGPEFRQKMLACVQPAASESDEELNMGKNQQEGRSRKLILLTKRT